MEEQETNHVAGPAQEHLLPAGKPFEEVAVRLLDRQEHVLHEQTPSSIDTMISEPEPLCCGEVLDAYDRYVPVLVRHLGVRPPDDADVAQEVFIAICRNLAQCRDRSRIKAWVSGVCVNKVRDFFRQRSRYHTLLEAMRATGSSGPALGDPHGTLSCKERGAALQRTLDKLPQKQREVFVLYELEQLSMKEIALLVRCPLNTAHTRHREAKQRILPAYRRSTEDR